MDRLLWSLALSLTVTVLLELSLSLILGLHSPRDLLVVTLVNILTNPLVVLTLNLISFYTQAPPPWYVIALLEISVVAAEGLLYRLRLCRCKWNPFLFSLMLNTISYFGGLLLS